MKSEFTRVCLILLIAAMACNNKPDKETVTSETNGITPGKIKLADLNGQPVDLTLYKGKTVFINFWATWCKPCLQEMPSIQRMMEQVQGEDIVFLFASDETKEQIEEFKNRNSFPFHYVRTENFEELNVMALPTTFIFDHSGKLVYNEIGFHQWDEQANIDLIKKIAN